MNKDQDTFLPRDSKDIAESYGHPPAGELKGVYTMLDSRGKLHWCPSGNEMRRVHELNPDMWATGPLFFQMSDEDYERFMESFEMMCDNF